MDIKDAIISGIGFLITVGVSWIAAWVKTVSKQSSQNTTDIEVLKIKLENNSQKDTEQRIYFENYFKDIKEYQTKINDWMHKVDQDITRLFERIDRQGK